MLLLVGIFGLSAFALADPAAVRAQEAVEETADLRPVLTLEEALRISLQNNLGFQTARYAPRIAEEGVREAEGIFKPSLDASYNHLHSRQQPNSAQAVSSSWQHLDTYNAGVEKYFSTGTTARLQVNGNRTKNAFTNFGGSFNPAYDADVALSLTQPLWQGFGDSVVMGPVYQAEAQLEGERKGFADAAENLLFQTESLYWNVVYARENYRIALETQELTARLLEEVAAKIEIGVMAPVDRIQVEAQAAQRRQIVIETELAMKNAEDNLRRALGIPRSQWESAVFTLQEVPAEIKTPSDFDAALQTAYANRKDLKRLEYQMEAQNIQRVLAEDQSQPQLNLLGGVGLNGLEDTLWESYETMDTEHYSWSAGLNFAVPLGYSSADARAEQARLGLDQLKSTRQDLRQAIFNDLRITYRSIESARENLDVARVALDLYRTQLDVARERFRLGLATLTDVLDFEEDYRNARIQEFQARINLIDAVTNFELVKGTLVSYHGLEGTYDYR